MSERKLIIGIMPYMNAEGEYLPQRYSNGIKHIGGEERIIYRATPLEQVEEIVDGLDAMLFSGGADVDPVLYGAEREPECGAADSARDTLELRLLEACMKRKMPILGICRGCQLINAAFGGTLVQDIPKRFGQSHQMPDVPPHPFGHSVRIVPGTMMHEIMGGDIMVNSYHHQCVDRLADGLIPTAYSPEGFIEAYEFPADKDQYLMAVQWHPERTLSDDVYSPRIFDRFLKGILEHPKQ